MEVTPDQPQGKKRSKAMVALCAASGVVVALFVAGLIAQTPLRVWYYSRQFRQYPFQRPFYARRLVERGPAGTRRLLQMTKGGTSDGYFEHLSAAIIRKYASHDVYPQVDALLADGDPSARAFAAAIAGHLRDKRYLPRLRTLTADTAPLPPDWPDKTVAARAKAAITKIVTPETAREKAERAAFDNKLENLCSGWRKLEDRP